MKIGILIILLNTVVLAGCLEDRKSNETAQASVSLFEGVTDVTNLGGFPPAVKVSWNSSVYPVNGYRVYALINDPDTNTNKWTAVSDILSPDNTSFLHSATDQVVPGQIITYKVQSLNLSNVEDGNNKQKSTIVFDGIQDVVITGKTTATVMISTSVGAFNEVRIYAQPVRPGSAKKLVATAVGNVTNINVTGLNSGVNYKFTANAYIAAFGREDGNSLYKLGQTYSDSFGNGKATDKDFKFQNVRLVQGFGDAPNEDPAIGQPTVRTIRITFNPFVGALASTKYRVIRGSGVAKLDTTTTTLCTNTTNSSCVVCTISGAGPQTCTDTNVAPPPKKYDYTIALMKKSATTNEEWVEELPTTNATDFMFSAHVPSNYMVLVQRESANYEMCYQMKSVPNPRKKNRCSYTGVGAVPYNSGPGKNPLTFETGFYDFGYNLFVDRHQLACNWSRAPACGPNGCIGNTFLDANSDGIPEGAGSPSNSIGSDGNVYFAFNNTYGANCYVKTSGTWKQVSAETTPSNIMAQATTVDPGPANMRHRPTLHNMTAEGALKLCNSHSTDYGPKRLMRRREWIVATPMPYLEGEPNAITDVGERWRVQLGVTGHQTGATVLNSGQCASGVYTSNFQTTPSTIEQVIDPSNQRAQIRYPSWAADHNERGEKYFIGSNATRKCFSRFGIQDPLPWNYFISFSDQFSRPDTTASPPPTYQGEVSDLDNGNRDFLGFIFNDTTMGASLNDATLFQSYYLRDSNSHSNRTFNYYNPVLGVPLFGGGPGQTLFNYSDYLLSGEFNPLNAGYGLSTAVTLLYYVNWNSPTGALMMGVRGSRWSYAMYARTQVDGRKALCAVEAE